MKFSALALLAATMAPAAYADSSATPLPVQTYFLPLNEEDVLKKTFQGITNEAQGPIQSYTSIAIGVPGTIIWYDHHEDGGFEVDPTSPSQALTEIWGDGDPNNGHAPGYPNDVFVAGDVIVLHSYVPSPRGSGTYFDGGDKIMSSFGIAMTRGCFPYMSDGSGGDKGSMLAGAVEVLDTTNWGKNFEAPVGEDSMSSLGSSNGRFEQTQLYVMAGEDGTTVDIDSTSGTKNFSLNAGQSVLARVNMGAKVTANKNVQVDLLAGDIGSTYEMRWFSLLPTEKWAKSYLTPVGNTKADVIAYAYNPSDGPSHLSVLYSEYGSSNRTLSVPREGIAKTNHLDSGSGTYFEADHKFMVFTIIDTVNSGQIYDWGVPVAPYDDLTAQVLVGWGDGCTNDVCAGRTDEQRSEIWVSPKEAATCTVDFNNDGVKDDFQVRNADDSISLVSSVSLNKWEGLTLWDHNDLDMTGAMVFCDNNDGPVPFAAVWGQNPDQSYSGDNYALDLGTLVPPYPCIRVEKFACLTGDSNGNGEIDPTDTCRITTRTVNNCLGTVEPDVVTTGECGDTDQYSSCHICLPDPDPTTSAPPATTSTTEAPPATTSTTEAPPATTSTTEAPPATTSTTEDPPSTTNPNHPGGGGGDPHFARWNQKHDSFHGECDLVMVSSKQFHNGAGFDLHARTTIEEYFSYIETAALRIGDNTLQFYMDRVILNGVSLSPEDLPMTFGGDFKYVISNAEIPGFKNAKFHQYFKVDLHQDSSILFKYYKKYLTIDISGNAKDFHDSVGLLGDFYTGAMISRDGDEMADFKEYGFEWQVNPNDPKLFLDMREPQLPFEQCRMPTAARPARRLLRGDRVLLGQAKDACAHIDGSDFDLCIEDVMMTKDIGLAETW